MAFVAVVGLLLSLYYCYTPIIIIMFVQMSQSPKEHPLRKLIEMLLLRYAFILLTRLFFNGMLNRSL